MAPSLTALYEHDRTWAWKAVLRALMIILEVVGIGLIGWALHTSNLISYSSNYYYYDEDSWTLPWNLITFPLSFIWCLTNLCILLAHSKWIHPGANVGCDLVLWLSFIVTALFSTGAAVNDLVHYYDDDYYGGHGYGYTSSYPGGTYTYPNGTTSDVRPPCPGFDSCAEKDNALRARNHRGVVIAVASAFAWLMVLFHFALFVSACRYTHQRNRGHYADRQLAGKTAEIEEKVIRRLEAEGRIMPGQPGMMQQPPQAHVNAWPAAERMQSSMIPDPMDQGESTERRGQGDAIHTVRDV